MLLRHGWGGVRLPGGLVLGELVGGEDDWLARVHRTLAGLETLCLRPAQGEPLAAESFVYNPVFSRENHYR